MNGYCNKYMSNLIPNTFTSLGAQFLLSPSEIASRFKNIKAIIFDWDGVFNNGLKNPEQGSLFAEPDAMGTNMLRFDRWRELGHVPVSIVLTGANNRTAIGFGERESFHVVMLNCKNKAEILPQITNQYGVKAEEVMFVFDDILDLGLAKLVGLPMMIRRKASPMLENYVKANQMAAYITAHEGGQHAVRELAEMLMALNGSYDETIAYRHAYDEVYLKYLGQRKKIDTRIVDFKGHQV